MQTVPYPFLLTWLQPFDFPHKLGICDRLFSRLITPQGICWVQTAAGIPWKLDLRHPVHRWIVYGKYDGPAFLNWARQFLPTDGVVIDAGANIGQVLLYLAQLIPQGRVLAFEPGVEQADWLAECLAANPTLPVELIRLGLGATSSEARLQNLGAEYIHGFWSMISETEGEPIRLVRLEDELARRSIERVDLWKLDVEGYELQALQGAESFLKRQQIRTLYVELCKFGIAAGEEVVNYLASFGYHCYLFNQHGKLYRPDQLPGFTNGLFLLS